MPIARITTQGLVAIALLVAALWACILTEHSITRTAWLDGMGSLRQLERLRGGLHKVDSPGQTPVWARPGNV